MSLIKKINDPNGKQYDDFSIGSLVLDTEPIPGSFNTVTSDAVVKAVDKAKEDMQEKIDEVTLDPSAVALGNVHLLDEVTAFPADGCILVDSETNGPGEMPKDSLLELTAHNALADRVATAFIENTTQAIAGLAYSWGDKVYVANENYKGVWDATKFTEIPLSAFIVDKFGNYVLNTEFSKIAKRSAKEYDFLAHPEEASNHYTGGYYNAYGEWVPNQPGSTGDYDNFDLDAVDYEYSFYIVSSATGIYRQVCVFNGVKSSDTFVGRYRDSDGNMPSKENPLIVKPGQIVVITATIGVSQAFTTITEWNSDIHLTESAINDVNATIYDYSVGLDLYPSSAGRYDDVADGFVAGPNGTLIENASFITYMYKLRNASDIYVVTANDTYLSICVCETKTSGGTRYRKSGDENTLPYSDSKLYVDKGKWLLISVNKSKNIFDIKLEDEVYASSLKEGINLSSSQVAQVQKKEKVFLRYVNASGYSDSTERVEVYVPCKVGFCRYDFVHSVKASVNCDCWRVARAVAVDDNFVDRFELTFQGEWECAVHLKDRDDFSGGLAHGDEVVTASAFFADGKKLTLSDLNGFVPVDEFVAVTGSNLYDPDDSVTIIALHGCEHRFCKDGLHLMQSISWQGTYDVTSCYLAMNLPLKTITDHWYSDKDVTPKSITYGYNQGIKKVCLYGDSSGVTNKFYLGEEYPTGYPNSDNLLLTDNDGLGYNKGYYVVVSSSGTEITSGTIWKAQSYVAYEIGK